MPLQHYGVLTGRPIDASSEVNAAKAALCWGLREGVGVVHTGVATPSHVLGEYPRPMSGAQR
jgi:hypothetical protein